MGMTTSPYRDRIVAQPGFEKELAKRTLTNLYNQRPAWLSQAHEVLDAGGVRCLWLGRLHACDAGRRDPAATAGTEFGAGREGLMTWCVTAPGQTERIPLPWKRNR
jgi:hypothetical protein